MKIELTAYRTVYEAVSKKVEGVGFGFDVNPSKLLRHLAGSLSLQAEAEAEYARSSVYSTQSHLKRLTAH